MKTFGFQVNNEVFAANSWYFRNALVRANNLRNRVYATTIYLELFFENLLLDKQHDLKNRYLHLEYHPDTREKRFKVQAKIFQSAKIALWMNLYY